MVTISRCLCLFLTLWMAGSKRPAVPWTVASDPWWGTQETFEIKRAGERFRGARGFAGAEVLDRRAYNRACQRHDDCAAFLHVTAIEALLLEFHYRSAVNLSNLYEQTYAEQSKNVHGDGPGASAGIRSAHPQLALTEMEAKAEI